MRLFFFIVILMGGKIGHSQDVIPFQPSIRLGSSVTYIWDPETQDNYIGPRYLYQELTWQKNISIQWHRKWLTGFNHYSIFTTSEKFGKNTYSLAGVFQQYHFLKIKKVSFFAEAGIYKGNYCTCGSSDPYKRKGLKYWELGLGGNWQLSKHINLDVGVQNFQLFNKIDNGYAYTQYIIGLDYSIFLKKKK